MNKVTEHLAQSQMSYWKHLCHSFKQSGRLMSIAVKSIIHGVFPWFFVNSGPIGVYRIYKEIRRLHHVQRIFQNEN
jgi:hypothetical protein